MGARQPCSNLGKRLAKRTSCPGVQATALSPAGSLIAAAALDTPRSRWRGVQHPPPHAGAHLESGCAPCHEFLHLQLHLETGTCTVLEARMPVLLQASLTSKLANPCSFIWSAAGWREGTPQAVVACPSQPAQALPWVSWRARWQHLGKATHAKRLRLARCEKHRQPKNRRGSRNLKQL